jgi:hypothetical protein
LAEREGFNGTVSRATLRLFATSSHSGFNVRSVTNNTWVETGLTYNNAPAPGAVVGTSGQFATNTWISINVTPYIMGAGTWSIALDTSNATALALASRESGGNSPQLLVEVVPG